MAAIVFHSFVLPIRFGHKAAPLFVEAKRNRVGHLRLGGEKLDFHSLGHAEGCNRTLPFIATAQHVWLGGRTAFGCIVAKVFFVGFCGRLSRIRCRCVLRKTDRGRLRQPDAECHQNSSPTA